MSHLQYTAKSHHLQWDMKPLKQFCTLIYRQYSPKLLRERHNIKLCKTKDSSILVLLFLQVELGIRSQRKFYRMCQLFIGSSGLERTRFYRRAKYLLPLFKLIRQALTKRIPKDELVIVDSFPLPVCLPVRNFKTRIFRDEQADISFNSAKQMWFYGFKVHMLVSLSGYVVNYLVTPASTHDSKACEELLEDTNFPMILADLGYTSQSLKQRLAQKGYQLWTPLRQNMSEAKHHNNWKLMAKRRTIETRFSVLCTEFDIQRPLVRSLCGLELWLESIIWVYNLRFFNQHHG